MTKDLFRTLPLSSVLFWPLTSISPLLFSSLPPLFLPSSLLPCPAPIAHWPLPLFLSSSPSPSLPSVFLHGRDWEAQLVDKSTQNSKGVSVLTSHVLERVVQLSAGAKVSAAEFRYASV